jgi:hypothetical protein
VDDATPTSDSSRVIGVITEYPYTASTWRVDAYEQFDKGRFSCPIWSKEANHFATVDLERNAANDFFASLVTEIDVSNV